MRHALLSAAAAVLAACMTGGASPAPGLDSARLDPILTAQAPEVQARYKWRHPKETLEFFGVAPGMTVVDVLPGDDGYYSKILIAYLGREGRVIGADYAPNMWKLLYPNEEFLAGKANWAANWTATAASWRSREDSASVAAFVYGSLPAEMRETADVVLMIRALHNFARYEDEGGYLTEALRGTMEILKPGGVVGVVQHRAPEANSDKWAEGDNGYLKQSRLIAVFEKAGFEFLGASEINANPADQPTESDVVWRLPPTLGTSRNNPELKAQMEAIGESDRMTLKVRKPK